MMALKWSTTLCLIFVGFLLIQNLIQVEAGGDVAAGGTGGDGGQDGGRNYAHIMPFKVPRLLCYAVIPNIKPIMLIIQFVSILYALNFCDS
jgi:hypothetical protein